METNGSRTASTIIVWLVIAALFAAADPSSFERFLLMFCAMGATFFIWVASYMVSKESVEKAKRQSGAGADFDENELRLRMLMDMLDDKEKARIRAKLMNGFSDGEVPVDEFLNEQSTHAAHFKD